MYRHTLSLVVLAGLLTTAAAQRPAPDSVPAAPSLAAASTHEHVNAPVTPQMLHELTALQVLFEKYRNLETAAANGYENVGCVSDPVLGGMGDHYSPNADEDLGRGDGTYTLERPQYLVYAPLKNGQRRLAALDYTVPYEKWQSDTPPEFFGIPFTRNDGFGVWMFHIWVFQHNPAGMFANFNPKVPQC